MRQRGVRPPPPEPRGVAGVPGKRGFASSHLLFLRDEDICVNCDGSARHQRRRREREIEGSASVTVTKRGD